MPGVTGEAMNCTKFSSLNTVKSYKLLKLSERSKWPLIWMASEVLEFFI